MILSFIFRPVLKRLEIMENRLMATLEEAVLSLEDAQAQITEVENRVEAGFDALEVLIAELKAGGVDQTLVDRVQSVADTLRGKVVEFDEDIVPAV
jgi:hypothetical protein